LEGELLRLLSKADQALARLDGAASVLPNPNLFVSMYVRHEAVLSSQIEGTQSTLEDILQYEMDVHGPRQSKDAEEVVNYVRAMNHGLQRLEALPLSLRLLKEIHQELMQGVRGSERNPGEFRTTQNWIGPTGSTLRDATFIPPPPHEMTTALGDLEKFLHDQEGLPTLIQCGLAHAQFETIHPFLDGNGRVGRLLITLLLCERRILERPLLYLSVYLKAHHAEYYDRLTAIRNGGDWEGWLRFFLRGVAEVSASATETARSILKLRETTRQQLASNALGGQLLDFLFERPVLTVRAAEQHLNCSYGTASKLIEELETLKVLKEMTGQKRNRIYRYEPYLALFEQQGLDARPGQEGDAQRSRSEHSPA
jgi:Fic family protein